MTTFVLAYHGGSQPKTPEEGQKHMQKYMEWVAALGDKALNPQMPLKTKMSVTADAVSDGAPDNFMIGMTIIEVDTMDEAVKIAQECPFLEMSNSSITVGEVMNMPG